MIQKVKINLLYVFCLLSGDVLTFFSGIFVAVAINILTCQLPYSVLIIGKKYLLVAVMLLAVAFFLIRWSIFVRPIHNTYSKSSISVERLGEKQCWYNLVKGNTAKRLILYLVFIVVLTLISFMLLIFPNIFRDIGNWIGSLQRWQL